jgi:hypothetical protein
MKARRANPRNQSVNEPIIDGEKPGQKADQLYEVAKIAMRIFVILVSVIALIALIFWAFPGLFPYFGL